MVYKVFEEKEFKEMMLCTCDKGVRNESEFKELSET
jgi:hypothetical protein